MRGATLVGQRRRRRIAGVVTRINWRASKIGQPRPRVGSLKMGNRSPLPRRSSQGAGADGTPLRTTRAAIVFGTVIHRAAINASSGLQRRTWDWQGYYRRERSRRTLVWCWKVLHTRYPAGMWVRPLVVASKSFSCQEMTRNRSRADAQSVSVTHIYGLGSRTTITPIDHGALPRGDFCRQRHEDAPLTGNVHLGFEIANRSAKRARLRIHSVGVAAPDLEAF